MDLSHEIINAVGITASTMLVQELSVCELAFFEDEYLLVVKGRPEHSQQIGKPVQEFPMGDKVFILYHK